MITKLVYHCHVIDAPRNKANHKVMAVPTFFTVQLQGCCKKVIYKGSKQPKLNFFNL